MAPTSAFETSFVGDGPEAGPKREPDGDESPPSSEGSASPRSTSNSSTQAHDGESLIESERSAADAEGDAEADPVRPQSAERGAVDGPSSVSSPPPTEGQPPPDLLERKAIGSTPGAERDGSSVAPVSPLGGSSDPPPPAPPSSSAAREWEIDRLRARYASAETLQGRVGEVLAGRYRLERFVARGGMGCVFLATQIPLERQVAIKLVVPTGLDPEFRRRFFLEASVCARLTHRHIVTVYDYGETESGEMFMAMEYLHGMPLSRLIAREKQLPADRACLIAIQSARALRAAHRMGVVHRDLKPSNVFLLVDEDDESRRDFVKLLDFGLVKLFELDPDAEENSDGALTQTGMMLGSPKYMSPEQIRSLSVDPRVDIYALGVILFQMLAGRAPFVGRGPIEILSQHLKDKPPSITEISGRDDFPLELEQITRRCLEKSPEARFSSMDDLLSQLKAVHRSISGESLGPTTASAQPLPSLSEELRPGSIHRPDPSSSSTNSLIASEADASSGASWQHAMSSVNNRSEPLFEDRPRRYRLFAVLAFMGVCSGILASLYFLGDLRTPTPQASVVALSLTSHPSGALVSLDGQALGRTPLKLSLPRPTDASMRFFSFRSDGFEEAVVADRLDRDELHLHGVLNPIDPALETPKDPVEAPPPRAPTEVVTPTQKVADKPQARPTDEAQRSSPRKSRTRRERKRRRPATKRSATPPRRAAPEERPPAVQEEPRSTPPKDPLVDAESEPPRALEADRTQRVIDEERPSIVDDPTVRVVE